MKKKYAVIAMALLMINSLLSCRKYLDIVENSNYVSLKTANDCQLLLDDYGTMNSSYPYDMLLSSDDYFIADKDYANVAQDLESAALCRWDKNASRASADVAWQTPYKRVFEANLVLEQVVKLRKEGSTAVETLDGLEGAALFYRSYTFWLLAQMYAQPFKPSSDNTDPGIPLRFTSDLNEATSRGTVKGTYDQITSDLQRSADLLPDHVTIVSRPGKAAAYAMLARCYLSMSDYKNALTNAGLSLSINGTLLDYNTLINTGTRYISTKFNGEILFQALAYEDYYGLFSNQYVDINTDLLALYGSNDLRNNVFFKDLNSDGYQQFNGSYDASSTLFTGLATDEVYLIRAECYARSGNTSLAMTDLNKLLRNRISNASPYIDLVATDPDDALFKILLERRKELVLRGLRWTDLRRLNLDSKTATTVTRGLNGVIYTLPPNDLRYTLLIPQEVISNSSMTQNPR
jgi:tetratricopeptide (TPR) repeat protein